MASKENQNYSGLLEPLAGDIVETYIRCNFSQPAAITDPETGKKVGVPIFPGSREVSREFFRCNLLNCDIPPGSTVGQGKLACLTAITTQEVEEEEILVKGIMVRRIKKRLRVAHGRYVHEGPVRTHEEFSISPPVPA